VDTWIHGWRKGRGRGGERNWGDRKRIEAPSNDDTAGGGDGGDPSTGIRLGRAGCQSLILGGGIKIHFPRGALKL
jgi:hypothetical protein